MRYGTIVSSGNVNSLFNMSSFLINPLIFAASSATFCTVRLLKSCWDHIKHAIHGLFSRCLALNHFPQSWKLAEVAMLPKVGKKDKSSVRSWRPIALLSCISKDLE